MSDRLAKTTVVNRRFFVRLDASLAGEFEFYERKYKYKTVALESTYEFFRRKNN